MGHTYFGMGGLGFWIILIILVLVFLPYLKNMYNATNTKEESALEIIKRRLAKGEISMEEYEELKKKL